MRRASSPRFSSLTSLVFVTTNASVVPESQEQFRSAHTRARCDARPRGRGREARQQGPAAAASRSIGACHGPRPATRRATSRNLLTYQPNATSSRAYPRVIATSKTSAGSAPRTAGRDGSLATSFRATAPGREGRRRPGGLGRGPAATCSPDRSGLRAPVRPGFPLRVHRRLLEGARFPARDA
jgi:hypothetical protein